MPNRHKGMSLIEVMVSLSLTCIIFLMLGSLGLIIKKNLLHVQKLVEKSTDFQLVHQVTRDLIHHAGFTPCANLESFTPLSSITISPQSIQFSSMSRIFTTVTEQQGNYLFIASKLPVIAGDTIIIADCFKAEVQSVKAVAHNKLTLTQPLSHTFVKPIYVGKFLQERLFIKKSALFYSNQHSDELSRSIVDLSAVREGSIIRVNVSSKEKEWLSVIAKPSV